MIITDQRGANMPIEPIVPLILVEDVVHVVVLEVLDRINVRIHGVVYEGQEAIARLAGI